MFINKMGSYHAEYGLNNQDSGFEYENVLCIVDGCSEGLHSEVGAKLFAKKLLEIAKNRRSQDIPIELFDVERAFLSVKNFITRRGDADYDEHVSDVLNYMCFTILLLVERENSWELSICGDGVVITQDYDDNVQFISIDHSSTPVYFAYSFVSKESLAIDIELGFKKITYSKRDYRAVGISSDGIESVIGTEHEDAFRELIRDRKEWHIRRKINQLNSSKRGGFFKDDVTIAMRGDNE